MIFIYQTSKKEIDLEDQENEFSVTGDIKQDKKKKNQEKVVSKHVISAQ